MSDSDNGDTPKNGNRLGGYKIGYGKPPVDHRFQKGKSGNPTGRRKRLHASAENILSREAERLTPVKFGGQTIRMTAEEIIYARHTIQAAQGNLCSIKIILEFMNKFERQRGFANVGWNEVPCSWQDEHRHTQKLARIAGN